MTTETKMIDALASLARTALDDPEAIDDADVSSLVQTAIPGATPTRRLYAILLLDEIIEMLNPSLETRKTFSETLRVLGNHIAERCDYMEATHEDDKHDERAYADAAAELAIALDHIDEAISILDQEGGEL